MTTEMGSWNRGAAKQAIQAFVERVTRRDSPDFVPPDDRVAVFDNDGTLWCEQPMPVELAFIMQRLARMARRDPGLRDRQPWKAAFTRDYSWLGEAITKHYQGDDGDAHLLAEGVLAAFAGMTVDGYQARVLAFLRKARHPSLPRRLCDCAYGPMIDLLRYLEGHGFVNYIASGGDRDFMRVVTDDLYGVPAERVVGSSNALCYMPDADCGQIAYLARPDVFDDGPVKPVRIWSRIGRRPILAFGNSNGDIEMLEFAGGARPALRLLLQHDDSAREFAYTAGAEHSLEMARERHWVVVSVKNDWNFVFAEAPVAVGRLVERSA
jgi:hypothetical protein